MFYQCYINKFLAERLIKAGVKSGTCIYVYGDLEIHPFLYQQGQKAGQPGVGAKINVKAIACLITTTEVRLPQEVAVIKITLVREAAT